MVATVYLKEGKFLGSRVDEFSPHLLGDSLEYDNNHYVISKIETREHIDYQAIVQVVHLVEDTSFENLDI